MKPQRHDVIVVGAGLVGASTALMLSKHSLSVALVEANVPQPNDSLFDLRVSAITLANQRRFVAQGLWPAMQARASAFRQMHVWDASGTGELHFDSADIGEPTLGYIIENRVMQKAFDTALAQQTAVTRYMPAHCEALRIDASGVQLVLSTGEQLTAQLVIGADGSRSWVRTMAGIAVRGWDYDHHALVTFVKTEKPHQETAAQRFLPTGPLAFLPLDDGYSSIVWSTSPAKAARLKALPDADFKVELADAFEQRLGAVLETGPRAVYPLRFFMTDAYVQSRLLLVGDAAHTMHPLAGQGVNLGFADVHALDDLLGEALASKRGAQAIGDHSLLRKYERARKADNLPMLFAVDSFQRLFGSDLQLIQWLRNSGMSILDKVPPLKNTLLQQAMGL